MSQRIQPQWTSQASARGGSRGRRQQPRDPRARTGLGLANLGPRIVLALPVTATGNRTDPRADGAIAGPLTLVFDTPTPGITITGAGLDASGTPVLALDLGSVPPVGFVGLPFSDSNPLNRALNFNPLLLTGVA